MLLFFASMNILDILHYVGILKYQTKYIGTDLEQAFGHSGIGNVLNICDIIIRENLLNALERAFVYFHMIFITSMSKR